MSEDARAEVFASIRRHLQADRTRGPRAELPLPPPVSEEETNATLLAKKFAEALRANGGHVHHARGEAAAAATLSGILSEEAIARLALSDSALVQRLASTFEGMERVEAKAAREELLEVDAGLSSAQWGIAETGTLILESETERHRLVSLLPPIHVAVLPIERIVASLGDGLRAIQRGGAMDLDRAVTFITGPSRTADIELTLVVGVHGPRKLHVILLEPESSS